MVKIGSVIYRIVSVNNIIIIHNWPLEPINVSTYLTTFYMKNKVFLVQGYIRLKAGVSEEILK